MSEVLNTEELKDCIIETGKKQKFIAGQIQTSEHDLSLIVTGKKKCSLDIYIRLCNVLGKPYGSFIKKDEKQASNQ